MMGKNRDKVSIVAAILEAANPGTNKTHIMLSANLSFSLLEKYLEVSCNAGFVQAEGGRYQLTELGREFLREYRHFHERYRQARKTMDSLCSERERLEHLCNKYRLSTTIKPEMDVE